MHPDRAPRHTAGLTTRLIVSYVRAHGGAGAVDRLLELAGDARPVAVLEDEAQWSTYEQKVALFEAASVVLEDPDVAQHIGRTVLAEQVGAPTKLLLRALGSPARVLRSLPRVSARFSTTCDMRALDIGRTHASIEYRLRPGFEPSRHDCGYNLGLLPAVTELFGLPPARIWHPECEVTGGERCRYEMEWSGRSRRPSRAKIGVLEDQLRAVVEHSEALQSTTLDLVSPADLDTVLHRIATRAAAAVRAQRYLLVAHTDDHDDPVVVEDGVGDAAPALARSLLRSGHHEHGDHMLVAPVRSARRDHGLLVAMYDEAQRFFPGEERMLEAYARQAAVALDIAMALEAARQRDETSNALLDLAAALADAATIDDVVDRLLEAVPRVLDMERASVALFDPATDRLHARGFAGYPDEVVEAMRDFSVGFDDTPELSRLFFDPGQRRYALDETDDPFLRTMLTDAGIDELLIVPIIVDGSTAGVITAANGPDGSETPPPEHLARRMAGLADQAALALERARLLEQERDAVERVRHLAYHDALTGLANGRCFSEHLAHAIAVARRDGSAVAVLFCDVDRFKNVNDSLGHLIGDRLLVEISERLRRCLRESDVLARLGGDEFAVLLERPTPAGAAEVASKIVEAVREPVNVDGHDLRATVSVGIARFPEHGSDAEALLKNADSAMYAAKARRSAWAAYDPAMNAETRARLLLESNLHDALERGELRVHYQPQIDATTGAVRGLEALVRWEHPQRGLLLPCEFIPLAEEAGLIGAVDTAVLRQACADAAAWHAAGSPVRVSVNVSGLHLQDRQLVDRVAEALRASGLPADALELELTETAAMHGTGVDSVLHEVRALGVSLALDDFGTGYSVYRQLRDLPVGRIKLDRSFVAGLPADRHDRAIVTALIDMAHEIGLAVTAEGVETTEQQAFLVEAGCDELQGYLFAPPGPLHRIAPALAGRACSVA